MWADDDDEKLKLGEVYAVVPLHVYAAQRRRGGCRQTDVVQEPPRTASGGLAQGVLGRDFEVLLKKEWETFARLNPPTSTTGVSGTPLFRNVVPQSNGKLFIDLFPLAITLKYAGVQEELNLPRSWSPSELLKELGRRRGLPPHRLRLWVLRRGEEAAKASAGEGKGEEKEEKEEEGEVRTLLAGKRLELLLTEAELNAGACTLELELRGETREWPYGDTTRAVRARGLWGERSAGEYLPTLNAKTALRDPLLNLVDYEFTPAAKRATVLASVTQGPPPCDPPQWLAAEISCKETSTRGWAVYGVGEDKDLYTSKGSPYLSFEELKKVTCAPLTHTNPWQSRLDVGDSVLVRVAQGMGSKTEWCEGRVVNMDHGTYPPSVAVEVGQGGGKTATVVMGLECTFLAPLGAHATTNSSSSSSSSSSSTATNLNLISNSNSNSISDAKDPDNDDDLMNGVTAGTQSLTLVKNVGDGGGGGGGVGVGGASSLPVAHPVRFPIPALAQGILPPLSTLDCSAPPEKGISPLRGMAKDKVVEFAEAELGQLMASFATKSSLATTTTTTTTSGPIPGVVGLRNLGNTCFMNSILQCLAAVEPLSASFEGERAIREINAVNHMGHGGRLTLAWAAFIRSLRHPTSTILSPLLIKEFVSEKAPQFTGYQQHDSGEFALYLLDGLCSDMLRAEYKEGAKHPIPYWEDPVEGGNGRPHEEVAKESWSRYIAREESIITDLFAGMTRSVLTCDVCKATSVKCDQWTSLILALPNKPELEKVDFTTLPGRGRSEPYTRGGKPKAPTTTSTALVALKTPATPRRTLTVAEVCTLLGRLERNPGMLPLVPEDLKATVEADPKAAMAASGYVCGSLSDCVFTGLDERAGEKGDGKMYFPVEPGSGFIACNLRIRWDTDPKVPVAPSILPPTHTLYEPFMVSVPANATTATVLDQIWTSMARFMDPTFRGQHSAQDPPYTVSLLGPVKAGTTKGEKAEAILSECAKVRCEVLKYSSPSEPFSWDWTTGTLMLVVERPEAEWKTEHLFPSFSAKEPTHPRLPPPGPAWKANLEHPVKFNESPEESPTLANLLRLFSETETLSGVEEVFCSKCKAHRTTQKALTLWRLPPILIINLKRFKAQLSQYGTLNLEKMYDPVAFPITGLDLSDSLPSKDQWPVPPPVSFHPDALPAGGASTQEPLPPIYDLFAVSEHGGGTSGGHYVASIQDFATGNWHKMDDSFTRPIHPKEVLTPAAYILFYRLRGTEGRAVKEFNASLPSNLGDVVALTESL